MYVPGPAGAYAGGGGRGGGGGVRSIPFKFCFRSVFWQYHAHAILMKYGNFRSFLFFSTGPTYGHNGLRNEKGLYSFHSFR